MLQHPRLTGFLAALAALGSVAACSPPPPYVYKENEFDRADETFNKPLDVTEGVTICYNSQSTTAGEVRAMAEAACREGGGLARFVEHVHADCPLLLINGARFSCGLEPAPEPPTVHAPTRRITAPAGGARVDPQGYPATPSAIYRMDYR